MMFPLYINAASSSDALTRSAAELIPAPDMRRRMSRVVKMGVCTAMECLSQLPEGEVPDAIITATGLGCLADSEKFLRNVIENDEQLLNPTPFIQSTFNTVGGAVALLSGNHCYNMTYVQRGRSFGCALIDAAVRVRLDGARNVLVGAFDETTPAQHRIMERMGAWRGAEDGEGSHFFAVSPEQREGTLARLTLAEFADPGETAAQVLERLGPDENRTVIAEESGGYHTCAARSLYEGVEKIRAGAQRVSVYSRYRDDSPLVMLLECI